MVTLLGWKGFPVSRPKIIICNQFSPWPQILCQNPIWFSRQRDDCNNFPEYLHVRLIINSCFVYVAHVYDHFVHYRRHVFISFKLTSLNVTPVWDFSHECVSSRRVRWCRELRIWRYWSSLTGTRQKTWRAFWPRSSDSFSSGLDSKWTASATTPSGIFMAPTLTSSIIFFGLHWFVYYFWAVEIHKQLQIHLTLTN